MIAALSILTIFFFFRWVGIKGMISFILGMGIMAWIFLSKNVLVRMIVSKFEGEEYIDSFKKSGDAESLK